MYSTSRMAAVVMSSSSVECDAATVFKVVLLLVVPVLVKKKLKLVVLGDHGCPNTPVAKSLLWVPKKRSSPPGNEQDATVTAILKFMANDRNAELDVRRQESEMRREENKMCREEMRAESDARRAEMRMFMALITVSSFLLS